MSRPLLCNVADLLARPGARRQVRAEARLGEMKVASTMVSADTFVGVDAALEWVSEGILATGAVLTRWRSDCRRCLGPVSGSLTRDFRELFEDRSRNRVPLDPEGFAMTGEAVDLEPLAREVVLLGLPLAPLCREDCRGLCDRCGAELNQGPCDCPGRTPDPRWRPLDVLRIEGSPPGD